MPLYTNLSFQIAQQLNHYEERISVMTATELNWFLAYRVKELESKILNQRRC